MPRTLTRKQCSKLFAALRHNRQFCYGAWKHPSKDRRCRAAQQSMKAYKRYCQR